jgi:streptogramin lyase
MTCPPFPWIRLALPALVLATGSTVAFAGIISVTKTGPGGIKPGQNLVYTLTVQNQTATGIVTVDDPSPVGLTLLSVVGGGCTGVNSPGTFPCTLGVLRPSEIRTIVATFAVPTAYSGANPIVNTATVTAADGSAGSGAASTAILRVSGFFPLPPCRVADTRAAPGVPLGGPPLQAGAARGFPVRRQCGLPDNANAVSFNLTVTAPTGAGDLQIYPGGTTAPGASAINYVAGQTRANNGVVPLGADGSILVQCDQASGRVDLILDVNGYFASTTDTPTPLGLMSRVRPAPEVELTFDDVTPPQGVTSAIVLDFPDIPGRTVNQSLKTFFPAGSPERALVPDVIVPPYVVALGTGGPGGIPTFVLAIVTTSANFGRTAEFHGFEDFRLGWDPPCVVPGDPTQEPRTFYAREPQKGEPALEEESLFGGLPAFVDISSGCGSNKGSGWNFSLYLTGRDKRTPDLIAAFMLQRLQGALTTLGAFVTNPTVAANLAAGVRNASANLALPAPALAMADMADFIGIVDANPGAFNNAARNVRGEFAARAQSASYMLRKLVTPGTFTEFAIPTANTKPLGITLGPDGNLWFAAGDNADNIGRITRAGVVTEFRLPATFSRPYSMTAGPDGNVWFTEANKIGRITPTGVITEFPVTGPGGFFGLVTGPDGNLWFTLYNTGEIGRITPTGTITKFPVVGAGSGINGLVVGPDGNFWFTEYKAHKIGSVTTTGALVAEFPIPTVNATPEGITVGPDGNLWFTERAGKIGRITTAGAITEFPLPTPVIASWLTTGPGGNLWFTEFGGQNIGRITTAGAITEFPTPTPGSNPYNITVGPDGNLWFTEYATNRIGRITP